jgi:hypothetical protein
VRPSERLALPDAIVDQELFDGDPLVIFIAFSVAVTWILFLFPLTLGLTAAWVGAGFTLGIELFALVSFFTFSFIQRNRAIKKLRPYLTREELLWPLFGTLLLVIYMAATVLVIAAAVPCLPRIVVWRADITNAALSLFVVKIICILSLLIGTYTTNKDMFVFFKSIAAERMRQQWLQWFLTTRYPLLETRVRLAEARLPPESGEEVRARWNRGYPTAVSTHEAFVKAGSPFLQTVWQELIAGRLGAPSWMLDVPAIANWAANVEEVLDRCAQQNPSAEI